MKELEGLALRHVEVPTVLAECGSYSPSCGVHGMKRTENRWVAQTFFIFHFIYGMSSFPTDEVIFFRGVGLNHQPEIPRGDVTYVLERPTARGFRLALGTAWLAHHRSGVVPKKCWF